MTTVAVDTDTGEVQEDLTHILKGTSLDPDRIGRQMTFEGYEVVTLEVVFGGTVTLDPDDAEDVALFEALRFGAPVDLTVKGYVLRTGATTKPDSTIASRSVRINVTEAGQ